MYFDSDQFCASLVAVFVAASVASLIVLYRGPARASVRRWATALLLVCATLAVVSWTRFGAMHSIFVDAPEASPGAPHRPKVERHQPFHFHEFFHYYVGAKYFRDLGYEGLYDCAALADQENAKELGLRGHVGEWIRDLDDVLRDKPFDVAIARCQHDYVDKMSPARWNAFRADMRALQTLVPDDWWGDVVYDAGFNPPPSWILLGGGLANVIPIRLGGLPTYLVATSLDVALLIACLVVLLLTFGPATAATATVYFGATFISSYMWNGGGFLRYTWLSFIVFGLAAAKRERWALAGALLGAAACDRIFPAAFAFGAAVPLAVGALRSRADRERLARFGIGFGATVAVLAIVSTAIFGFEAWRVFFTRIGRHGDVYYVMHIGLKKVMTWRDWVPGQNFHGHPGLIHFHDWNVRLRETWASMRWMVVPVQLVTFGGAIVASASARRPSYEAALLVGITAMFCFSIPANYYYVVLALVPALLLRAAATAPRAGARVRDWALSSGFSLFWLATFAAPKIYGDDIVFTHFICVALYVFLLAWIVAWLPWAQWLSALRARSRPAVGLGPPAA